MSVKISKQAHNLSVSKWIKRRIEEFGWCPATLLSYFPKSGSINIEETRFDSEIRISFKHVDAESNIEGN